MESGLVELPEGFGQLSSLEKLWLTQNALRKLPSDFGTLQGLRALWLGDNLFKEVHYRPSKSISTCLTNQTYLAPEFISVYVLSVIHVQVLKCPFSGVQVPRQLLQLTNLQQLYINLSPLKSLPAEISRLQALYWLCVGPPSHLLSLSCSLISVGCQVYYL